MKSKTKAILIKMNLSFMITLFILMKVTAARLYNYLFRLFRLQRFLGKINPAFQFKLFPKNAHGIINQLIYVDPKDIKWGGRPPIDALKGGFILQGDWDLMDKKHIDDYINTYIYCRTVMELFVNKMAFHESEQYKEMKDLIEQKRIEDWRVRGSKNLADVEEYFMGLYRLFDNIKEIGYKTQIELGSEDEKDEIHIYIDRNGELIKTHGSGHHRLTMVKILNIDQIPVLVTGVHHDWAAYCTRKYKQDLVSALNEGIKNDIASKRMTV